jgi:hypothetical protein
VGNLWGTRRTPTRSASMRAATTTVRPYRPRRHVKASRVSYAPYARVHFRPCYVASPVRLKVVVCLMCRFLRGLGCQLFTTLGPCSNWSPGNKAARLRQPRQHCSDYRCDEALGATCEAARLKGQFACGKCLGHNDDKLRSAGCSAAHNAAFCNNMTCVPSLFGQCKAARSMGGLQCAVCIGKNESLLPTVCTNADEKAFCASKPPRPPPPPSPPLK